MGALEFIGMGIAATIGVAIGATIMYIGQLFIDYEIDRREEEETR